MEGSESEASFDAYNINPQRFINEVLNSVDDMLDGAFEFSLQQASEITASGDTSTDKSEELGRGVSSIRQLTQVVLDKRMEMWEKYCLRHCFSVPEGFVPPKAKDSSTDGLLFPEVLTDEEFESQLDSLRNKLSVVGMKSVELQREISSLENQCTLSCGYHSYVVEAIQLLEQNSTHKMFHEIGETASKLQWRTVGVKIKRKGDDERARVGKTSSPSKKWHMSHDFDHFASLEDIQEAADILRDIRSSIH